jgi:hypothetical protein
MEGELEMEEEEDARKNWGRRGDVDYSPILDYSRVQKRPPRNIYCVLHFQILQFFSHYEREREGEKEGRRRRRRRERGEKEERRRREREERTEKEMRVEGEERCRLVQFLVYYAVPKIVTLYLIPSSPKHYTEVEEGGEQRETEDSTVDGERGEEEKTRR